MIINKINYKTLLFAVICILIGSTPVKADWQFTKWGMTPTELQKASPIKLSNGEYCPVNNKNRYNTSYDVKYASDWNVGSMNFIACYIFVEDKLHVVNLYSQNVNRDAIISGLSQRYGQPKVNTTLQLVGIVRYQWDLPNEKIEFAVQFIRGEKEPYPYIVSFRSKSGSDETTVRDKL